MTFRRTISGDFEAFRVLQTEIVSAAEQYGFTESRLFEIQLTIEESLINAIKRFGSGVKLLVDAELSDSGLKLTVREAG